MKKKAIALSALFIFILIIFGCGMKTRYVYDLGTNFSALKTYNWVPSSPPIQDPLVEKNIQFIAGEILAQKGFTLAPQPDFLISTSFEYEIAFTQFNYEIRALNIAMINPVTRQMIWRGTASDTISTDPTTGDLKRAVEDVLKHFPPKGFK